MPKLPISQAAMPVARPDVLLERARRADAEGRADEAVRLLQRVLTIDPLYLTAINELGIIQFRRGARQEGVRQFETLLRIEPNNPVGWKNYGIALLRSGMFQEAFVCFDNAFKLNPNDEEAAGLRANTLYYLGQFQEAVAAYASLPNLDPEAAIGMALGLMWSGRHNEALEAFDRMIASPQTGTWAAYNKGTLLLLLGDLPAGFRLHRRRWELPGWDFRPRSNQPLWLGETNLDGKVLYIHWEQGIGETLQFCRYATLAAEAGARVILETQKPLERLISTLEGVSWHLTEDSILPDHDLRCPMPSLPLAFGTTVESVPARIPYLHPDPVAVAQWRDRLRDVTGAKIGLVWGGASRLGYPPGAMAAAKRRSLPLAALAPLATVPGCAFFSLQVGPPEGQAAHEPGGLMLHDYTSELKDFADTAALVENLDLLISVDTATAHLAGAIGKPVWLLNRFDTDWRWLLDREDTPWYPTMRIFRQPTSGDWAFVMRQVTDAVRAFVAGHATGG